jgi:acetyl-CoA acetyltransferase
VRAPWSSLGHARPRFANGTMTIGDASRVNGGAAALIIASESVGKSMASPPSCDLVKIKIGYW